MPYGRRTAAAALGTLCAGTLLSGCLGLGGDPDAGTNGVGKLPATTIEQQARAAAAGAHTVHLAGTVVSAGQSYRLDMRLSDTGGVGEVSAKAGTFQLLRIGGDLYLKAGPDFWRAGGTDDGAGGSADGGAEDKDSQAAADHLGGKYVRVPPGDPAYRQFSGLTDKKVLIGELFTLQGTLSVGPHRKVNGARSIAVEGAKGAALDVALKGTPYPLRYTPAGGTGTLTLSDWGEAFSLNAPPASDVVDYGSTVGPSPKPSASASPSRSSS